MSDFEKIHGLVSKQSVYSDFKVNLNREKDRI